MLSAKLAARRGNPAVAHVAHAAPTRHVPGRADQLPAARIGDKLSSLRLLSSICIGLLTGWIPYVRSGHAWPRTPRGALSPVSTTSRPANPATGTNSGPDRWQDDRPRQCRWLKAFGPLSGTGGDPRDLP